MTSCCPELGDLRGKTSPRDDGNLSDRSPQKFSGSAREDVVRRGPTRISIHFPLYFVNTLRQKKEAGRTAARAHRHAGAVS